MHIFVYAWFTHVYVYIYTYIHPNEYMCIFPRTYVNWRVCDYMSKHLCVDRCIYIRTNASMNIYIYICIYKYTRMSTCMHIHTDVFILDFNKYTSIYVCLCICICISPQIYSSIFLYISWYINIFYIHILLYMSCISWINPSTCMYVCIYIYIYIYVEIYKYICV